MKPILLAIQFILLASPIFAQIAAKIDNQEQKLFLKFKFYQISFQQDDYLPVADSLPFINYDGKVIPVKADTLQKMYVFKSIFHVDDKLKNTDLSIFLGSSVYPYYVYLNKIMIGRLGSYKEKYTPQVHAYHEFILSKELLNFGDSAINEIQIQAYPKYNVNRALDKIFISSFQTVSTYTFWRNIIGIRLMQASMYFAFILFLYFVFGYLTKRDKSDRKYIYFAFFCLSFAASYVHMAFSWDSADQLWTYKIARSGMAVANLFLVYLAITFTGIFDKKNLLKTFLAVPIIVFVCMIILQKSIFNIERIFAIFASTINMPYQIIAITMATIAYIRKRSRKNLIYFIGSIILLIIICIDSYNYTLKLVPYAWYIPLGYSLFIIAIFFILATEQTAIYHLSLDRATELEFMKNNLEKLVDERTAQIETQKGEILKFAADLQETNHLLNEQKEELIQQKEEILAINEHLETQQNIIIEKNNSLEKFNKHITDSINYAKRIQHAVLPQPLILEQLLPHHFILFKPRNIVSGDFYFVKRVKQFTFICAADCTGHGVPGAFMSILGMAILNEIVRNLEIDSAAKILNELRKQLKTLLQQTGAKGEQQDGMDIAFCIINNDTSQMQFSGANSPLWLIRNNELAIKDENKQQIEQSPFIIYDSDKQPIGIFPKEKPFTNHEIQLNKGDQFYIFSDGYESQFGGEKGDKLKIKRMQEIILRHAHESMNKQSLLLEQEFDTWRGKWEQVDDVLVVGVKI